MVNFSANLHAAVRAKYGDVAHAIRSGGGSCCATSTSSSSVCAPVCSNIYSESEIACLPAEAVLSSLGCGNPTALVDLHRIGLVALRDVARGARLASIEFMLDLCFGER